MEGRSTRSRVTLPDDILQVGQASPLKKARSQRRGRTNTGSTTSSTDPTQTTINGQEDDGDELSPRKDEDNSTEGKNGKRSASPPPHDSYGQSSTGEDGRELKRLKTDLSLDDLDTVKPHKESRFLARGLLSHIRNPSDSDTIPSNRLGRPGVKSVASHKPHSTGYKPTPPPPSPPVGRASSAPLFPSEYTLPQIDLRHPPPSPSRARSRSPSKESTPKLRMHPLPKAAPSLESIPDESEKMNVDSPIDQPTNEIASKPPQDTVVSEEEVHPTDQAPEQPLVEPPSPKVKFSEEVTIAQLETPVAAPRPLLVFAEMSPLTPYPETPFQATQERLKAAAVEKTSKQNPIPKLVVRPVPKKAPTPLPSSSSNGNAIAKPQPKPALPNGTRKPSASKAATSGPKEKVKVNAFNLLMKKESKPGPSTAPKPPKPPTAPVKDSSKGPPGRIKMGMKPKQRKESRMSTVPPPLVPLPDEAEDDMAQAPAAEGSSKDDQPKEPTRLPTPVPAAEDGSQASIEITVEPQFQEESTVAITEPRSAGEMEGNVVPQTPPQTLDQLPASGSDVPPVERSIASQKPQPVADQPTPEIQPIEEPVAPVEPQQISEPSHPEPPTPDIQLATDIEMAEPGAEEKPPDASEGESREVPAQEPRRPGRQTKLPVLRQPSTAAAGNRLTRTTRSSSLKQVEKVTKAPEPVKRRGTISKPTSRAASRSRAPSRARSVAPKSAEDQSEEVVASESGEAAPDGAFDFPQEADNAQNQMATDIPNEEGPRALPNGSPMRVASPVRQSPRLRTAISSPSLKAKTPLGTPTKSRIPVKRPHSPSPAKLVRSASLFSRPPRPESRLRDNSSALSSLSSALDKLRKPGPSRPSTSMGFNPDRSDEDIAGPSTQDDTGIGSRPIVALKGKAAAPLGKTSSFGPQHLNKGKFTFPAASGSKSMKQSTLVFQTGGGRGKPLMGAGFGRLPKASRNPGLATVIGSPVKGAGQGVAMQDPTEEDMEPVPSESSANGGEASPFLDTIVPVEPSDKANGKQRAKDDFSTRRASTISASLSESIVAFREENAKGKEREKGNMGPPPLPERLSARSTGSSGSPGGAGETSSTPPGRRSTRTAAVAAVAANHALLTKKAPEVPKSLVNEALKFMRDCIIYVDVKTEDSEEAGSLFVEMLEGVGARILKQVGQSCTHIVYKNGLQSTINKYNLLRDPKPLVVGIAWVVDCVEQRRKVEEADYLIDLDEVSLLTNPHKRRRSLLPKPISRQFSDDVPMFVESGSRDESNDGDVSMESTSSVGLDDLTPLERARRRKSILISN